MNTYSAQTCLMNMFITETSPLPSCRTTSLAAARVIASFNLRVAICNKSSLEDIIQFSLSNDNYGKTHLL